MKPIYVALIAIGTGVVGFVAGGGLGLLGGTFAGGFAGGAIGGTTGACMTIDAATTLGILTPDQAEKIGVKLGQDLKGKGVRIDDLSIDNLSLQRTTASCNRLVRGINQAKK